MVLANGLFDHAFRVVSNTLHIWSASEPHFSAQRLDAHDAARFEAFSFA